MCDLPAVRTRMYACVMRYWNPAPTGYLRQDFLLIKYNNDGRYSKSTVLKVTFIKHWAPYKCCYARSEHLFLSFRKAHSFLFPSVLFELTLNRRYLLMLFHSKGCGFHYRVKLEGSSFYILIIIKVFLFLKRVIINIFSLFILVSTTASDYFEWVFFKT